MSNAAGRDRDQFGSIFHNYIEYMVNIISSIHAELYIQKKSKIITFLYDTTKLIFNFKNLIMSECL